jgi:hypothetical protein
LPLWAVLALALTVAGSSVVTAMAASGDAGAELRASLQSDDDDDDDDDDVGVTATATTQAGAAQGRPSHIHAGTCADLDPTPAFPLNNLVPRGGDDGNGVEAAETEFDDLSLDELLAQPYAVNVHESADAPDVYVACGDIAGPVLDGKLIIALHESDGSGLAGIAILEGDDDDSGDDDDGSDDDDDLEVKVYVAPWEAS